MRGLDEQPTIHEGVTARALEKKGIISERCETNRQIRKDNALLRRLKEMVVEMIRKIRGSVTNIAENLESNWMYMVEAQYHLTQILNEKQDILNQLEPILDDYEQYVRIQDQIRKLAAQRDKLIAQRKATPILQIRKRNELAEQIDSLAHQLEGRRKTTENLLKSRHYPSEKEIQEVGKRIHTGKEKLDELDQREKQYSLALQRGQTDYRRWMQAVHKEDADAVSKRLDFLRNDSLEKLVKKLKSHYGNDFRRYMLDGAVQDVEQQINSADHAVEEARKHLSVREKLAAYHEEIKRQNESRMLRSKREPERR